MRSYRFNVDRIVNRLVPHYMGGRKLILFLQSCMSPLYVLSDKWEEWANMKRIEATMTSQVILFEHYLTYRFKRYFSNPLNQITISEGTSSGTPLYWKESETMHDDVVLYGKKEAGKTVMFEFKGENLKDGNYDFTVNCPAISKNFNAEEIKLLLASQIDKYKIANKKYNIVIQ